jgi:fatty acid desaturase
MTTLTPDRVEPVAGLQEARRAPEPATSPARNAAGPRSDSGTRAWLRRKAVATWMNVLIAGTVTITVVTAGVMGGRPWPGPGTWGVGALKLFAL